MSPADEYRTKATEYAKLGATARSLKEGSRLRKLSRSYSALADNEDWLAGKQSPTIAGGADDARLAI